MKKEKIIKEWIMVDIGYLEVLASGFVGTIEEATKWADELWECDLRYDYMYDANFEGWELMYEVDSLIDDGTFEINGKYYKFIDEEVM